MLSRTRFGSILFTMSMRMCSLASRVHGEHSRNTMLKSTHCSSSQEFDDVSNILRTVALSADTTTAARISQAKRLPIHVSMASIRRAIGSNDFSNASRAPTFISLCPANDYHRQSNFIFGVPTTLQQNQACHLT